MFKLSPEPTVVKHVTRGDVEREIAVWDLKKSQTLNINCKITKKKSKDAVDYGVSMRL